MKASRFFKDFTNAAAGNLATLAVGRILPVSVATLLANQCGKSGLCEIGSNIVVDSVIEVAFGLAVVGLLMATKPLAHKLWHGMAPLAASAALMMAAPHAIAPHAPAPAQSPAYHMDIQYRV